MKLVRLKQSTPEWLEWRKGGVTASDVSALFGKNPYKTEWQLWAEKSGLRAEDDIMGNPYVRRGKTYEYLVREHIVQQRGIGIFPVCAELDSNPLVRASLDGIDHLRNPWETKIPSEDNFIEVRKNRHKSDLAEQYFYQVQQQMFVTDAKEGFLVFGRVEEDERGIMECVETVVLSFTPDVELHKQIEEKTVEFMRKVHDGIEPEKDPERDVFVPSDPLDARKWAEAALEIRPLLERRKILKEKLDAVEKAISDSAKPVLEVLGKNKTGEFAGLRAMRTERVGHVDWKQLLEDSGIDPNDENKVNPYRKSGSVNYKYTLI
jgi:putative phage-type endonuclease